MSNIICLVIGFLGTLVFGVIGGIILCAWDMSTKGSD